MAPMKDLLSREAIRNVDRLVLLSDGVYAIALTILVLDIKLPASFDVSRDSLLNALESLEPNILAYIISFIVIGLSWRAHNLIFLYVKRYDTNIFWLNLLLLLSVAFIPFPTSVLALGINEVSVVFYAICLTIAVVEEVVGSIFRRRWARQEGKVTSGISGERNSPDDR